MSILKVAHMGNPVLRQVAEPIPRDRIRTEAFQRFCDDLYETMLDEEGVGLAAPQVHVSLRVVVFDLDDEGPMWLVNPVVTPIGEDRVGGYEGCLSLPDMRGRVERWRSIRVEALDREGQAFAFEAHGWAARVVQHECDHLDGVLYIDRADTKSMAFLPEYKRFGPLIAPNDEDEADLEDDGEE